MPPHDHHFRREDRTAVWQRIARHVEANPADLRIAIENLNRWEALGRVHTGPLEQWRQRILPALESRDAFRSLISFLKAPNHDSEPIKSCSPFVGIPMDAATSRHDS